eukprot:2772325-Prymnesium_polylepis.4
MGLAAPYKLSEGQLHNAFGGGSLLLKFSDAPTGSAGIEKLQRMIGSELQGSEERLKVLAAQPAQKATVIVTSYEAFSSPKQPCTGAVGVVAGTDPAVANI